MQALILEDDPGFQAQLAQALMGKGFNVLCVETLAAAEAFLRLAKDPDLAERIGAGARARYLERHRPEIMAANHLALWERLLARHGRR